MFGERLKDLMIENKIKSEILAEKIKVDGSTVRLWCSGNSDIFLSNILKLADYFGCSLEYLLGKSDTLLDYIPSPPPPFYSRLIFVMEEKQVSQYRIIKDTVMSSGNFSSWKKGADPFVRTLIDVADYLNVTLDYLVGRDR